jgi:hypothetical protein
MSIGEVKQSGLRARNGDRLLVRGHHVGERERGGEILEVLGEDGLPPYVVRWSDDGHISRVFPGSDAFVKHLVAARRPQRAGKPSPA